MADNVLSLSVQQFDDLDNTLARRVATVTDSSPSAGDFRGKGILTTTSITSIGLPIAQSRQVYVRNTHASAKITVTWTPTTGASATICVLGPGDAIALWSQTTGSTYGISALSLTADITNATYETFVGG
jgi:hypothetical protein